MDSGPSDHVFSMDSLRALLNKLWNARSEWYNIGLGLGLSANELKSIDQKERKPGDYLREVLIEWLKQRNSRKSQLIEALRQPCVGYENLAEDLHTWVPPANATQNDDHIVSSASMTLEGAANTISDQRERVVELSDGELQNLEYRITKDVTEIHEKFATLQTQIRESLSNKGICAKKVAAHVIAYGIVQQTSDEKLKFLKHDSLEEVFSLLSDHWSFLDYDLLKSIVKNYGNEDEESIMEEYQKQLKLFCERRVSEVPKGFIQNKSEHDLRDKVIIKLKCDHPRLKDILDLKLKVCNVMDIEPAKLQIVDVHLGCVEVIFIVSRHTSYVFERPLTKQQWEDFQSASIKPNFEAVITYIKKELECNDELLDKLVSDEQKKFTPSGRNFFMKVRESGWLAPDNLTPLYDLLERVNRHDIVHKAKLEGLVHGDFAEFEEREKDGQSKELSSLDFEAESQASVPTPAPATSLLQSSQPPLSRHVHAVNSSELRAAIDNLKSQSASLPRPFRRSSATTQAQLTAASASGTTTKQPLLPPANQRHPHLPLVDNIPAPAPARHGCSLPRSRGGSPGPLPLPSSAVTATAGDHTGRHLVQGREKQPRSGITVQQLVTGRLKPTPPPKPKIKGYQIVKQAVKDEDIVYSLVPNNVTQKVEAQQNTKLKDDPDYNDVQSSSYTGTGDSGFGDCREFLQVPISDEYQLPGQLQVAQHPPHAAHIHAAGHQQQQRLQGGSLDAGVKGSAEPHYYKSLQRDAIQKIHYSPPVATTNQQYMNILHKKRTMS